MPAIAGLDAGWPSGASSMLLFALTIFASAFLLFLVQPIIAKEVLPWFGGSSAVWTTCLVFFQVALLGGYGYAHLIVRRLSGRRQVALHAALLVASLAALPIVPSAFWKPQGNENPVALILGLLAVTLGLPFFLLSATSPLLQAWFARRFPTRDPYRLFALSNLASLAALLSYPFAIEPRIPTRVQAGLWSAGYVLFALACMSTALRYLRSPGAPNAPARPAENRPAPPAPARQLLWCALAATGSILLLSVTSHITQNVAAVPLLWVVPLAIYLTTFVLCFESSRLYPRETTLAAMAAILGVMAWSIADSRLTHELALQLGVFCAGLFVVCMFCHGELARLKPAPSYLTRFYLMVSLGGAGGAVLVGVVAPLLLPAHFELPLILVVASALLAWQVRHDALVFGLLAVVAGVATVACGLFSVSDFYATTIVTARNFYGVLRVQESGTTDASRHRSLISGTIMHGLQYSAARFRRQPTSYYTTTSGIGRVLETLHPRSDPLRVGVIGLGTGTLAAYGTPGDVYRFYEIDPDAITIARRDFTYLCGKRSADRDVARGCAPFARARGARRPRSPRRRRVFERRHSRSPAHVGGARALRAPRQARWRDRVSRHEPLPRPRSRRRRHRRRERHAVGVGARRRRERSGKPQRLGAGIRQPAPFSPGPASPMHRDPIPPHPDWHVWTDDFNDLFQALRR